MLCEYCIYIIIYYISRVAKLANHMLIHFKLAYQGAWPPLLYTKHAYIYIYNIYIIKVQVFIYYFVTLID